MISCVNSFLLSKVSFLFCLPKNLCTDQIKEQILESKKQKTKPHRGDRARDTFKFQRFFHLKNSNFQAVLFISLALSFRPPEAEVVEVKELVLAKALANALQHCFNASWQSL